MLQLHINEDITNGTLQVSWCLDKELLDLVKYFNNPAIVLILTPSLYQNGKNEVRKVVKLYDLMTFIELPSYGTYNVWGYVHPSYKEARSIINYTLFNFEYGGGEIDDVRYKSLNYIFSDTLLCFYNVIKDFDSDIYYSLRDNLQNKSIHTCNPIEINIPKEIFAKEPAQWEKKWVNHFYENDAFNQCQFRKRRLFAYTVQPFLLILSLLFRLLLLIFSLLSLNKEGITLKFILNPMQYSFMDNIVEVMESKWLLKNNKDSIYKILLKSFLMPIVWVIPLFNIFYFNDYLLAITFVLIYILWFLSQFPVRFINFVLQEKFSQPIQKIETFQINPEEEKFLTCSQEARPLTIKDLPLKKRTIKLRYQDLKSKICKPFARQ